MVDILTTVFEFAVFLSKVAVILVAPVFMILLDFRRFKAHYGKRTFFQYSTRLARSEVEAEDPASLHAVKTTIVAVWFVVFSAFFFG